MIKQMSESKLILNSRKLSSLIYDLLGLIIDSYKIYKSIVGPSKS